MSDKVIVNSWNEWDPLKHVIVGRADGTCIPAPEPALDAKVPEDSDMRGQFGPRTKDTVDKANELLDNFSSMLEKRGIKVDRPTPLDFNQPTSTPDWKAETMFGCMPPRDVLLTVGNEILEATMSYRCRWFEYLCYRPLLKQYYNEDPNMRHESAPKPRLTDADYRKEIVKHIKPGQSELEIAIAGRDKMEREIAKSYPDAEYMDTWVWFQSGINTDGAHNPKTNRALQNGDILSLNTFPMISGYYTALERTLFVNEIDDASLKAWEANVKVHKRGLELIKPGVKCSEICEELNNLFAELGYLQYRTFGYGHSFGMLSHFYGREAGLELREDIDTVLEKNMVISMEPMIMIPEGKPGAGGYREHDILVIKQDGAENITKFPFGPDHNIIKN